jgi:SAM-dependent methyltransferase
VARQGARDLIAANPAWSLAGVRDQYSDAGAHADLYRYLAQWLPLDAYLNVGYSGPGQAHLSAASPRRLVDHLAEHLLALHARGPHAGTRRLLDVASGRGGPAVQVSRRHRLAVVGVDITPHNVARARDNARAAGVADAVRFCVGSALALPLADGAMPLVWSIESPAHFPDKAAFLREIARVVAPGGAFALADLLVVSAAATASAGRRRIYDRFLAQWDVPYLETAAGYHARLEEAGFAVDRAEIVTAYNLHRFRRHCRTFLWLFRVPPLYLAYRPWIRRRTGADLAHVYEHVRASYCALRLGMIDYGLFWAVRR